MLDIYCNRLDVFLTGLGGLGWRESLLVSQTLAHNRTRISPEPTAER